MKKVKIVSGWSWGRFIERIIAGVILIAIAAKVL